MTFCLERLPVVRNSIAAYACTAPLGHRDDVHQVRMPVWAGYHWLLWRGDAARSATEGR